MIRIPASKRGREENMNITITAAADKFIRRMVRFAGKPGDGFRLTVSPGGCSGLASNFAVEKVPVGGDAVLEQNGTRLFLPLETQLLLEGATIDFVETVKESGFVFRDVVNGSCGCGSEAPKPGLVSIGAPSATAVQPLPAMEFVG
jgi:iron-sulfur cluster assembly protein